MKTFRLTVILLMCCVQFLAAQQRQVTGVVKTTEGTPLAGVTVVIKGKAGGTVTDTKGAYSIKVTNEDHLIFSFIGMESKTINIGTKTTINTTLEESSVKVEEVVAIGYGVQKKSDLTGSVSSVGAKDLQSLAAVTVDQLLQGQMAGVRVSANSGAPGEALRITIRGGNSMNGSNEPLYVIDGFPIMTSSTDIASDGTAGDAGQTTNILSSLNPNDIESIEVLKDASATAIYGSKGANGVVMITTKQGSGTKGKDVVDVSYSLSLDEVSRKLTMLDPWEWAQNYNGFMVMSGGSGHLFDGGTDKNGIFWPTVDDIRNQTNTIYGPWGVNWQDEIFQLAKTHNLNVSLRGSNDNTNYAISGNMLQNEGIIPNTDFSRYNAKASLTRKISKTIKANANVQITRSIGNQKPTAGNTTANEGVIINSLRYNNVFPVYAPNGSYFSLKGDDSDESSLNHPLMFINDVKNQLKTTTFLGTVGLEITPMKNFSIRSNLNYKYNMSVRDIYFPRTTVQGNSGKGRAGNTWAENMTLINENFANYNVTINKIHSIGVMAGFSYEQTDERSLDLRVLDFFSDDLLGSNLGEGAQPQPIINDFTKSQMVSVFGRVNYTLDNKYMFTATFRTDGSTKFSKNNKWANFPSLAFAWRAKEETFLRDVNWLSNLKVRAGYGLSGSQGIKAYQSLYRLYMDSYYFDDGSLENGVGVGNMSGSSVVGLGNDNLKWETTAQFNAGIDMGFQNNKYSLTVDYYNKETRDLHQMVNLPYETGYSYLVMNMGKVRNRGFEASINANFKLNKVNWVSNLNYSMNRNKVLDLGSYDKIYGPNLVPADGGDPFFGHITTVGRPMSSFYGFKTNGIIQNQEQANEVRESVGLLEPGEVRYVDVSGPNGVPDGKIDSDDRVILGDSNPDFEINFNNRFSWKRFEFSFNIMAMVGNDILNANLVKLEGGTCNKVELASIREAWTVYNPSNTMPKLGVVRNKIMSDRYIEDGSFIKLKNVMFAYNFKGPKKSFYKNIQVYLKGSNLFTLTKYKGYDPEVNQYQNNQKPGVDNGSYPSTRTYTMGVSISF